MSQEDALIDLIDCIGEAALDPELWPSVLTKLADVMGAAKAAVAAADRREQAFALIAPRTDPQFLASYKDYWALHNPLWARSTIRPPGEIFSLDDLMPREDFTKTAIYNEWWRPARCGLAVLGANLFVEGEFSALICVDNAPERDVIGGEQVRIFALMLRHIERAVRIQRRLWRLDLDRDTSADQLETLPHAVLLVDSGARIVFANAAAEAILVSGDWLRRQGGCLDTAGSGPLRELIASCGARPRSGLSKNRGGDFEIARGPGQAPLQVMVAPLGVKGLFVDVPWLGLRTPVAIITVTDPDVERRRLEQRLRDSFGLTPAESGLATEIVKGDGRKAAAQRRGVALSTARAQLSSIYDKTGTRRQAELVRLLHDLMVRTALPK